MKSNVEVTRFGLIVSCLEKDLSIKSPKMIIACLMNLN